MDGAPPAPKDVKAAVRRLARGVLAIAHTRFELLAVEVQEERERWVRAFLLALGIAACALLAGGALMVGIGLLLWPYSQVLAVVVPFGILAATSFYLYRQLMSLIRDWRTLPATFEQLQKDRECLNAWLD